MSKILELAKRIASTGGLETKTTETISGTYDSAGQQRLLSHAYTIEANLTITNGELILSRLADNGTGMTVEFGSDVTLSGDGTLMLGDLGQGQPNQDFSASRITGELGSGVTIGGGVTFPTGHVLQVKYASDSIAVTAASDNPGYDMQFPIMITPTSTSSKFMCFWDIAWNGGVGFGIRFMRNSTVAYQSPYTWLDVQTSGRSRGSWMHLDSPDTTSNITYNVRIMTEGGGSVPINPNGTKSHMTVMEIVG